MGVHINFSRGIFSSQIFLFQYIHSRNIYTKVKGVCSEDSWCVESALINSSRICTPCYVITTILTAGLSSFCPRLIVNIV